MILFFSFISEFLISWLNHLCLRKWGKDQFNCKMVQVKTAQSCLTPCNSMDCSPPVSSDHGIFQNPMEFCQNNGVGSCSLLQCIFPTQGSNPGLPLCRQILYHLSHQEAQEYWSGYPIPSSGDLPNPVIQLGSPSLQVDSLPAELPGKPENSLDSQNLPWQRTHEC